MEDQMEKFSLKNSNLLYAEIFESQNVPVNERWMIKVYGHVIERESMPLLQVIGFENKEGKTILTQTHPIGLMCHGINKAIAQIYGNNTKLLPIEISTLA